MSLVPAFELGLWNAWLLIVPLIGNFMFQVKAAYVRESREGSPLEDLGKKEKNLLRIYQGTMLFSLIFSVFLPLKLGTAWFIGGFLIYLLGMIFATVAILNFATTPLDKPVTKGLYRISRNPMYFGAFLMYIGTGVACASWVYLLLTMALIIMQHILIITEERWCLEKYGNAYREYMNRTPRWIGILKSRKEEP